jgi:hypothetical protein
MASEEPERIEVLQGTLDLIVVRALARMGPQHAYSLAARFEQIADHPFPLNQGTLYRKAGSKAPGKRRRPAATRSTTTSPVMSRRFVARLTARRSGTSRRTIR